MRRPTPRRWTGGPTLAVLGCGVDRPWPAGPTADRIALQGLLLSEHAPGTPPRRHHFPLRNRILAALSDAVVVIEAAHRSGSLITARWAADQGQQVLAVPGRVDHPMSRGVTRLLREGATPVDSPAMLLEDVYGLARSAGERPGRLARDAPCPSWSSRARGHAALEASLTAAELSERTGVDLQAVLATLAVLEALKRAPGGSTSSSDDADEWRPLRAPTGFDGRLQGRDRFGDVAAGPAAP